MSAAVLDQPHIVEEEYDGVIPRDVLFILTTSSVSSTTITQLIPNNIDHQSQSCLMKIPIEVLNAIFDCLSVESRLMLTLTCKQLAVYVALSRSEVHTGPASFLIAERWMMPEFRFCCPCTKYRRVAPGAASHQRLSRRSAILSEMTLWIAFMVSARIETMTDGSPFAVCEVSFSMRDFMST